MKKGFTIVELLAVIIIISILIIITGLSVASITRKSKKTLSDIQKAEIINAAKNYMSSNMQIEVNENECKYITLETLNNEGFLEKINDLEDIYIKIELDESKELIDYKYDIVDSIDECIEIN